jgi:PadR family transcriptional regulator PadR
MGLNHTTINIVPNAWISNSGFNLSWTVLGYQRCTLPTEGKQHRVIRYGLTFALKSYIVGFMAEVLGNFEQAVLLSVLRLGDDAYGRAILNEVQTRLDREVAAGAVHATLNRLEGKGLLTSSLGPGTEIRAGRPRRYYKLSSPGQQALKDARAAVNNLWRGFRWPLKGHL